MPGLAILPAARPDPFAGQNAQAFMKIFQTLGESETLRRRKMMQTDILGVLESGGGLEDIAGVVQKHQQPQYDTGLGGIFQRIGGMFAQAPGAGITEELVGQAMRPTTGGPGRIGTLPGWWPYATEQQQQDYMGRVGGPLVQVGQKLLPEEDRIARAKKEHEKAMAEAPLTDPQIAGYGEAMATRLSKAKRHWIKQPGRINYPEKELFKQWKIFCGMYKFKNDTQKEQILNLWQNEIKNKAAEGWFGKETDFDPTDPKWRKAIGLPTTLPIVQEPTPTTEGVKKRQGFLGREESEFPAGFPPTAEGLMAEFKEIEKQLSPENAKELRRIWNEAARNDVSLSEFLKKWRSYMGR